MQTLQEINNENNAKSLALEGDKCGREAIPCSDEESSTKMSKEEYKATG